jgi:hypothetical protein
LTASTAKSGVVTKALVGERAKGNRLNSEENTKAVHVAMNYGGATKEFDSFNCKVRSGHKSFGWRKSYCSRAVVGWIVAVAGGKEIRIFALVGTRTVAVAGSKGVREPIEIASRRFHHQKTLNMMKTLVSTYATLRIHCTSFHPCPSVETQLTVSERSCTVTPGATSSLTR